MQSDIGSNPVLRGVRLLELILVAVLFACGSHHGEESMNAATQSAQLQEIESFTGLRFPKGVTLIHYEREMESDALIRAKFVFTPSQWQSFLSQSPLDPDTFEDEQRYLLGSNFAWWDPQGPEQLPTAQAHLPDARVLNVGVDRSDPQRFVVFFIWHRT
jgi:hypothetical protein